MQQNFYKNQVGFKIRRHMGESPITNFSMSRCIVKGVDGDRPFFSFLKFCKNVNTAEQRSQTVHHYGS